MPEMNLTQMIIYDYRDEFHAKLFRVWLIIKFYGVNKNKKKTLTLDKLHLFDFFLCNQQYINLFISPKINYECNDGLLYSSNISCGEHYNLKPTISVISVLKDSGFIEIEKIDNDFYCYCTDKILVENEALIKPWVYRLKLLKPLLNKSTSNINKKLLEVQQ